MYMYGMQTGHWMSIPNPPDVHPSLLPCVISVGGLILVTSGSSNSHKANGTINVFSMQSLQWGHVPLQLLDDDPKVCVQVEVPSSLASPDRMSALIVRTGRTDSNSLLLLNFVTVDCSHMRKQNYVRSANGQSCEKCPDFFAASEDGICLPCATAESQEEWQNPFCYKPNDRNRLYVSFGIAVALQLLVVPAMWAVTRVITASKEAAKNERAATQLSEAVAQMMFERAGYLETVKNPTRIERALSLCVQHMKKYSSFFLLQSRYLLTE